MRKQSHKTITQIFLSTLAVFGLAVPAVSMGQTSAQVTVKVVTPDGTLLDAAGVSGFRWVLEEDATRRPDAYIPPVTTTTTSTAAIGTPDMAPGVSLHTSNMPVLSSGHVTGSSVVLTVPDNTKRYYVSVLPDQPSTGIDPDTGLPSQRNCDAGGDPCFTMSGTQISPVLTYGATAPTIPTTGKVVSVIVSPQPLPTAQIRIRAFQDNYPINNTWDDTENGLGGWEVIVYDFTGGLLITDNYGNPLGTEYDASLNVTHLGNGTIHTLTQAEFSGGAATNPDGLDVGEALIKNIAPGKYGVQVIPPTGQAWQQTSTVEGTPGQDVWVKANEPRYFAEFGPAGEHAEFGFVCVARDGLTCPAGSDLAPATGGGHVHGRVVSMRMSRPTAPPSNPFQAYTFANTPAVAEPLPGCWVGVNDSAGVGVAAKPCNDDSTFDVSGLTPGRYQLVVWDRYLDLIFNIQSFECTTSSCDIDLQDVRSFRWYGAHDHYVFNDDGAGAHAGNGIWDADEAGIPEQAINLRYRDGSIYGSSTTDNSGYLPFDEVFPFFSFLVAEVDYARFNPTGVTVTVDDGGTAMLNPGSWQEASGKLINPQLQLTDCTPVLDATDPLEAACQRRTETGPALLEAFNAFIGSNVRFEWGKKAWGPGENGGITGVVYYATTRAENDPRYAAAETWEPGIPRVQVNLYCSIDNAGTRGHPVVDAATGALLSCEPITGAVQEPDVDNYPLGNFPGPEDVNNIPDAAGDTTPFDYGDAFKIVHTDSFDDFGVNNCPPGNAPDAATDPFYFPVSSTDASQGGKCYDNLRNFNQVRPGVFDGGYAFGAPFEDDTLPPGYYVIETVTPPGFDFVKEEDKNVDFGDTFKANTLALPPICVGDDHVVPDQLSLFPGIGTEAAGQTKPYCNRKIVEVVDGKNAAADFYLFTPTPIAAHAHGFILNDLANEFDPNNVNFGEKWAPSFIPVSVRTWDGFEVYHTTSDAYGVYDILGPSSFRINTPMPSGVSANMLQVCLNSPMMQNPNWDPSLPKTDPNSLQWISDPHYNKQFSQFCYTFNFHAGTTTYLDTPVLPISAYASPNNWQLDAEYPDGTPGIFAVNVTAGGYPAGGPVVNGSGSGSATVIIQALGDADGNVRVPDPSALRDDSVNGATILRNYGFGTSAGQVLLNGTALPIATGGWTNKTITLAISDVSAISTGQLEVVKADGKRSINAVTLIVNKTGAVVRGVNPGETIQHAIDDAAVGPGDIVVVPPGTYAESVIMTKPIQLQGWGAGSTTIVASQSPSDKIAHWRIDINRRINCAPVEIQLHPAQANNNPDTAGECGFRPGTGAFLNDEGAGILVASLEGAFNAATTSRIDGFTITGADQSGGIVLNAYIDYLQISNNVIENNQSTVGAGGIRVGVPSLIDVVGDEEWADTSNDHVSILYNHVSQNGSLFQPGAGIGIYNGSNDYVIAHNYVSGNFATEDGAGIAHYGLSDNGLIADNQILFNQTFDQSPGFGTGGGVLIGGHETLDGAAVSLTAGSGNVKVLRNRIQGNGATSGNGGGIALRYVNGADVLASPTTPANWYHVDVLQNEIVNNAAGWMGGGIWLRDTLRATIINNTVVDNDSTGTANDAFGTRSDIACIGNYPDSSCRWPAGIVSHGHTAPLASALAGLAEPGFSDPRMVNNIVLGNRSLHWESLTETAGAAPGFVPGTLVFDGFEDFGVVAGDGPIVPGEGVAGTSPTAGSGAGLLTTTYSVVASTANITPTTTNQASFTYSTEAALLTNLGAIVQAPYLNTAPGYGTTVLADGTTIPGGEFPITTAAALDEGGNFIDVHFGPLTPGGATNYRLVASATNVAHDAGAWPRNPNESPDIEGTARPMGGAFDAGADELALSGETAGSGTNAAPIFVAPSAGAALTAMEGAPFSYALRAIDPNGDVLVYALTSNSCSYLALDASTGLLSGSVPGTAAGTSCSLTASATDPDSAAASVSFTVGVTAGGPVANINGVPDSFAMSATDPTTWVVPAPGVLANDANYGTGTLGAVLVTNLPAQYGSVALALDGRFVYTPAGAPFSGATTFTYAPVACADATCATPVMGTPVVVTLAFEELAAPDTLPTPPPAPGSTTFIQCPLDDGTGGGIANNGMADGGEGTIVDDGTGSKIWRRAGDNRVCKHMAAGDGFVVMADGKELYTFGFNDVTGVASTGAIDKGLLNAHFPAPTISLKQGEQFYLSLTNAGTVMRPDLFDPHTVHFHGFPNASSVFDGVPESSIAINQGNTLTYYYNIVEPGTYMYHCHVEAAEHMQMGMLGNLFVLPGQDDRVTEALAAAAAADAAAGDGTGTANVDAINSQYGGYSKFVYNDGDGSTGYDVSKAIQIGSFDSNFHELHLGVQPLPFAEMHDNYPMLNGRGYPDTVGGADAVPAAPSKMDSPYQSASMSSQTESSLVTATQGQRILLRISNLNVTQFYTLATTGLTMRVVGAGAKILRGPGGIPLYEDTNSITLGGGEAVDVLIDTDGIAAGTYYLYSTNLNELSNGEEDFGGMMTEIRITAP